MTLEAADSRADSDYGEYGHLNPRRIRDHHSGRTNHSEAERQALHHLAAMGLWTVLPHPFELIFSEDVTYLQEFQRIDSIRNMSGMKWY